MPKKYIQQPRTPQAVSKQINGLVDMKRELPPVSLFDDHTHARIDAMVQVLAGSKKAADFFCIQDPDNLVYLGALQAEKWLDHDYKNNLYENFKK